MFKNRSFLIGLGLGIILGALLLQLILAGAKQEAKLSDYTGSTTESKSSEISIDASKLSAEPVQQQQPATSVQTPVKASGQTETQHAAGGKESSPSGSSLSAEAETAPAQEQSQPPQKETQLSEKITVVRIPPAANLTQIAALLKYNGLIESGNEFIAYIRQKKQSGSLRAGYFMFKGDQTPESIRIIITGEPLSVEEGKELLEKYGKK